MEQCDTMNLLAVWIAFEHNCLSFRTDSGSNGQIERGLQKNGIFHFQLKFTIESKNVFNFYFQKSNENIKILSISFIYKFRTLFNEF